MKAGEVSVEPAAGYKTLGEVAMLGGSVVVTTKEGLLKVERGGATEQVAAGKTVTVPLTTARAPMPTAPPPAGISGAHITTATALGVGSVAAGGLAAVLSGISMSRAGDANSSASKANSTASIAASNAAAATSAANAATSAANAANSTANSVGCALNNFANSQGKVSPYMPPASMTCP